MLKQKEGLRELALFAGAGGGILGGHILGWRTVCAVELDAYCQSVLLARQRDGCLSRFPIWDDVRTFDGHPWRGNIDVISGGFPCQDISSAGKRAGLAGERSGLWREFDRIIGEVLPEWVFIENSPNLRTLGLVTVLQDLARLGFDAEWGVLGASTIGAPHKRKRMWIVAHHHHQRLEVGEGQRSDSCSQLQTVERGLGTGHAADANGGGQRDVGVDAEVARSSAPAGVHDTARNPWWPVSVLSGVDDGLANRVDRIRATGNGQVSGVAALAGETLRGGFS